MASPIDNYSQQVIRSRYALAPLPAGLRSGTLYCTAKRSERSERAPPHRGYCKRFSIRNRLQKFLSFFETVYSTISPVSACNCSKNVSGPVSTRPTISILSRIKVQYQVNNIGNCYQQDNNHPHNTPNNHQVPPVVP